MPCKSGLDPFLIWIWFQPMWGTFSFWSNFTTRPGKTPRPLEMPNSSLSEKSIWSPTQTPRKGLPEAMKPVMALASSDRCMASMESLKAPTPGRTTPSALSTSLQLLVTWTWAPTFSMAFATLCRFPTP